MLPLSAATSPNSDFFFSEERASFSLYRSSCRTRRKEKCLFSLVITQELHEPEYLLTSSPSQIYKQKFFHVKSKQSFWKE